MLKGIKPSKDLFMTESQCDFFYFIPLRLGDKYKIWSFETGILNQVVPCWGLSEKVTMFPYERLRENIKW